MFGRYLGLAGASGLLFLLCSCGTGANPERPSPQPAAQPAGSDGLPALTGDALRDLEGASPRRPEALVTDRRTGIDTFKRRGTFGEFSERLRIGNYEAGQVSWAMYRFSGISSDAAVAGCGLTLTILNHTAQDHEVWVAYADFGADKWVMRSLEYSWTADELSQYRLFGIDPDAVPTSPADYLYIAILAFEDQFVVDSIELAYDEQLPAPVGLTATVGTVEGQIELRWVDPAITYDPAGPATFNYDAIRLERTTYAGSPNSWQTLKTLAAGTTTYTDGMFQPLDGQTTYHYRLRTLRGDPPDMLMGLPSAAVSGRPGMRPIGRLRADPSAGSGFTTINLDADSSTDADGWIAEYRWSFGTTPGNEYMRTTEPFLQTIIELGDTAQIAWLTLVDDSGLQSTPVFAPINSTALVSDDPAQADPGAPGTILGDRANELQVVLGFDITGATPNFEIEFDSYFTGSFEANDEVPIQLLKPYTTAPNVNGSYTLTSVPLPEEQPFGLHYMAIRVRDQAVPPREGVFVWPQPAHVRVGTPVYEETFENTTLVDWTWAGTNGEGAIGTFDWRVVDAIGYTAGGQLGPQAGSNFLAYWDIDAPNSASRYGHQAARRITSPIFNVVPGEHYVIGLYTTGAAEARRDAIVPEVTFDNGQTWHNEGGIDGWRDTVELISSDYNGWTGTSHLWTYHTATFLANGSAARIRFTFISDGQDAFSGMGLDSLTVSEK
jgi:hypothetical protein